MPPGFGGKGSGGAAGPRRGKRVRKALRDVPLSHVYKLFRTKKVRVNGARGRAEQQVAAGDVVTIRGDEERLLAAPAPATGPQRVKVTFGVLHEDADVLAVDKPAGLAVHPGTGIEGATLVEMARAYLKVPENLPPTEFKASPAHRLDRETSGIVLVARTRQAMVGLTALFTEGDEVKKTYLALVKGKMSREVGTIDQPLAEHEQTSKSKAQRGTNFQEAITRWKVLASTKEASLLAVTIETGRTHQIRRHLEAVGHPVAGDRRYGDFAWNRLARTRWGLRRMALHAWKLTLPHPVQGGALRLEAPLPAELVDALARANLPLPPGAAPAKRGAPPPRETARSGERPPRRD
jgi:23S rRNA pseudouridine955/2504/2580 synthase